MTQGYLDYRNTRNEKKSGHVNGVLASCTPLVRTPFNCTNFTLNPKFSYHTTDKKPKPENIDIFTLKTGDKRCKVVKWTLADVWKQGFIIRINNFGDKEKSPHSEKDIKNQVRIYHF